MPDILTLLIILTPLAGLAWYAWTLTGAYQRRSKAASLEKLRNSKRYRGVTIRNGRCTASHRITNCFYNFDSAPALPVKDCKALRCTCVYTGLNNRRYTKRREGQDQRSEVRFEPDKTDRRQQKDRRKNDNVNWQDSAD